MWYWVTAAVGNLYRDQVADSLDFQGESRCKGKSDKLEFCFVRLSFGSMKDAVEQEDRGSGVARRGCWSCGRGR